MCLIDKFFQLKTLLKSLLNLEKASSNPKNSTVSLPGDLLFRRFYGDADLLRGDDR